MNLLEWRAALQEFVALCFVDGKYVNDKHRSPEVNARLDEIQVLTKEFAETHPRYMIVCVKACYLGCGVSFEPLEIWGDSTDPETMHQDLLMLNRDAFAGPDCFEMAVDPR